MPCILYCHYCKVKDYQIEIAGKELSKLTFLHKRMIFQVSDTAGHSRAIRGLVLLQGLISFGLNTFVVALIINLIAGLLK